MGRHRKKTRTHLLGGADTSADVSDDSTPKSLVVRRGKLGRSAKLLVDDLRRVMSPFTARKLHEKKSNTLKDFVSVAGVLGVTHLLAVSQTESGPNLRVGRLPQGPTLCFKIASYSLSTHVRSSQKRPITSKDMYAHAPLVVLNNFEGKQAKHVQMVATTFRAMFPAINVQTVRLAECKRVLLVDYCEEEDCFDVRSYFVRAEPAGLSKSVRNLLANKLPDLGDRQDVSEVVDALNNVSDSEAEDPLVSQVLLKEVVARVPRRLTAFLQDLGKGNVKGKRSVVKLREIGPRLRLALSKVEQGAFEGEVLFHKFMSKTDKEVAELRTLAVQRKQEAEERRAQQEANVEKKRQAEEAKKDKKRLKLEARLSRLQALPREEEEEEMS